MSSDLGENGHVSLHLRRAILSAMVLLPMFFIFGFIAGTGVELWERSKASALLAVGLPIIVAGWLMHVYRRTEGLME